MRLLALVFVLVGCAGNDLPAQFTERIDYATSDGVVNLMESPPGVGLDWEALEEGRSVHFTMLLVPGDQSQEIEPFYMSATEVTWSMFANWAFALGVEREEIHRGLGPSRMAGEVVQIGMEDRPVISVSWRAAEAYCAWLSQQTGKTYRLPTESEWLHAMRLGGGIPEDRDELMEQAWLVETAEALKAEPGDAEPFDPFGDHPTQTQEAITLTGAVMQLEANDLGLYDMLGNAAEWVVTADGHALRGGHYRLKAEHLAEGWRLKPDDEAWHAGYSPQMRPEDEWYDSSLFQGFRIVCEPVNMPE